jgi:hypothetical protein
MVQRGEEKPTTADYGFVRSPLEQRSEIGALGHTSCSRKGSERLSSGLEPIYGSNSRLRRHPLGGYDHNLTAILEDQLPHIVQNVVHLGIRQVVELYPARPSVDAAGDMAIGFDESVPTRPATALAAICARSSAPSSLDRATPNISTSPARRAR